MVKRRLRWNEKPEKEKSRARLFESPDNPLPAGGLAYSLLSSDKMRIRAALWTPPGEARGTVVLLQGRTEMIEKYFEVVGEILARGLAVMTLDWRGQGASTRLLPDSLKGHVGTFADYLTDLRLLLSTVGKDMPKPWILLAHSMGGNIALQALHDFPRAFAGAALSAPMTDIRVPRRRIVRVLARLVSRTAYVPGGAAFDPLTERFETNPVTHDAGRFQRNQAILTNHPILALGSPTWGWLRAAFAASDRVQAPAFLRDIRVPILIMSAGEEALVDNHSHGEVVKHLAAGERATVAGAKHELLQETNGVRIQVWQALDRFFERALSAAAEPLPRPLTQ